MESVVEPGPGMEKLGRTCGVEVWGGLSPSIGRTAGPPEYDHVWGARLSRGPETTSLIAQLVKNMPAMQETQVRSLGQEDPPEEGMATHSSILAWEISWTEEPGGL